ncbi:MAG: Crp/Fnr family transcriptional regulator [Flavobacteriales bacterium]|nr:Crp/Fnr family transcriptional regulator [Flavobacteriales bacterium]
MDPLQLIRQRFPYLSDEDLMSVGSLFQMRRLEPGESFIKAGRVNYTGALVIEGLLRNYHHLPNGAERTVLFTAEGQTVGAYSSIIKHMPAVEHVVALETTMLLTMDMREFKKIMVASPNLMQAYAQILETMLLEAIERIDQFVLLSAEHRYLRFKKDFPDLEQRIPQKHLASYLGITAISLSRMRNRMVKRKLT